MNPENEVVENASIPNPVPEGWMHASEDVRRGGIVYSYPDGSEFHLTREALHQYVFPNRD
jgi:hypothetical protein